LPVAVGVLVLVVPPFFQVKSVVDHGLELVPPAVEHGIGYVEWGHVILASLDQVLDPPDAALAGNIERYGVAQVAEPRCELPQHWVTS
jgi:hypothetical protein